MRLGNIATVYVRSYVFNKDFRSEIQSLRMKFGIPEEGFETSEQFKAWSEPDNEEFDQELSRIAEKYLQYEAAETLFSFIGCPTETINMLGLDSRGSASVWVNPREKSEHNLSIKVGPNATRDEVVEYVDKNWKSISKKLQTLKGRVDKKTPLNNENLLLLQISQLKRQGVTHKMIASKLNEASASDSNKKHYYEGDISAILARLSGGYG